MVYLGAGAGVLALVAVAIVLLSNGPGSGPDQDEMRGMSGLEGMDTVGSETPAMDMGGTTGNGTIRLRAEDVGTFGITFGTVDVRPLDKTIRAVGLVEFDETRMAYVAPKFGGWVERLHVDFTGQPVRRGQALLDVYSPELVTAQEELLLAARMAETVGDSQVEDVAAGSRDLLEFARRRLRYWDISDAQIERLLETGEVRKTLTLYAPVSGIVMEKDVFEGQAYQPGKNLYMIADLSEVWVSAEVFEADAALVSDGMPAEITVAALPGRTLSGRVEYVYPTLEDRTRSMRARIALANPGGRLKPGMYATVRFTAELGERLTVPASAVLYSGERAIVFADLGGGELMPHEVELGVRGGDFVQVVSGLEPGQRVVTSAQFLLDSESNLAEVMRAMVAQMNLSDMEGMDSGGQGMAPPPPDTDGGR
jgi:RND family efflux transporter MFP subunit